MTDKYNHMESTDKYGTPVMEDKSVKHREAIGDKLYNLYLKSKITRSELANLTGVPMWKIDRIFAGDEDFTIYEITHIAGVLGYDFLVVFSRMK